MYLMLFVLIFLSLSSFLAAHSKHKKGHILGTVLHILLCAGWLTAIVYVIDQI